jgi:replicative DNA helicase
MSDNMYNLNIERAVLSAIIFDPQIFEEIASKLAPHDFYFPFHQHLFVAMEELSREEKPIDEEFLKTKLLSSKNYDEVGMLDILAANAISNTNAYIEEIKSRSTKRALATLATTIKKVTIEDDLPTDEIMNLVEKKLYEITQNSTSEDFREAKEITTSLMKEINRLKSLKNSKLLGVDTGFRNLNETTSGFGKGDLIIIAARPAMGKTSLVLNMTHKAIERGEGVAFFSLEMPAEQLMLRLLSTETSLPLQNLRVGNLQNDEEWSRLSGAVDRMAHRKLFVDDGGYATIHHVRSKLRKLKSQHPEISMAIIDYLQLMSGDNREGRQQVISEISRGLKQLARELQIPILALSQLNRGVESRDNKRPMLSDLRESGSIEQDADIVMFVYRDDVYREAAEKEKEMKAKAEGKEYTNTFEKKLEEDTELILGKHRNGPTGTVKLIFHKQFTRFVDAPKDGQEGFDVTVYNDDSIDTSTQANIRLNDNMDMAHNFGS